MDWLAKFIGLTIVYNLIGWFIAKGLIWVELLLKPYTEFGETLLTWGQHSVIILVCTILAMNHSD